MSARAFVLCAALGIVAGLAVRTARAGPRTAPPVSAIPEPTPATLALGSPESRHRLVVWSDYECAVCALLEREAGSALRELTEGGRLRLEVRHFPLRGHRRAPRAAAVAICAERSHRGWAMHQALLGSASRWRSGAPAEPWFASLADSLGLDRDGVRRCAAEASVADAIAADVALGRALGLVGVPAVFLDGRLLTPRTPRALVRRVRAALG